eukprot:1737077-Rhodomonas_salina.1
MMWQPCMYAVLFCAVVWPAFTGAVPLCEFAMHGRDSDMCGLAVPCSLLLRSTLDYPMLEASSCQKVSGV